MNKTATLFFLLAAFTTARAQRLTISPADSVTVTAVDSSALATVDAYIFLHNTHSDSIVIKWGVSSSQGPAQWGLAFCDNRNCYNLPTPQRLSLPVAPGDSIDMHAQFGAACVSGSGFIVISASIQGDTNAPVILTYKANITATCATGINNLSNEDAIEVFPNPATDQISISGLAINHNVSVQVIDIQGRLLSTEDKIAGNNLSLNVSALPAGLYFIKKTDRQTNQVSTKRFSKI